MRLILGKFDISIPFEVGVKQGDSVAPVLFLFIMRAFSETLEEEWVKNNLQMIKFRRKSNSPQSSGRITRHPAKTFSQGTLFELFCMLYVDDGAFAFETRKEMEVGSNLVFNHFRRFGLQMHVGSKSKPSKTEYVFSLHIQRSSFTRRHGQSQEFHRIIRMYPCRYRQINEREREK